MKKSELIAALEAIPGDPNVKIYDHRKLLHYASEEPTQEGLYDIEVFQLNDDLSEDEIKFTEEMHDITPTPFIVLAFDNEDFDDDGTDLREG